jgi:hypothetical protein
MVDTTKLYIEATFRTILNELAEIRAELEALKAAAAPETEALYDWKGGRVLWEGEGVLDNETIGASDYTGDPGRPEFVVILKADDIPADMGQRVHIVITEVN